VTQNNTNKHIFLRREATLLNIREQLEEREFTYLNPHATFSRLSKGRDREEVECDYRTIFQRDRDRILHCKSFRRLKSKTQVFLLPKGDHYRTRLTHTLEVSQIARTMAKALRLNEDLVEAIALGHDLGHTPFGHAGERALNSVFPFSHNEQSVRVVERVERQGQGLNLTWEVRDGIRHHKTSGKPSTLEGQLLRLSDKIAYINHDIDDAIRGGILVESDIPPPIRKVLGATSADRLDTIVNDIIIHSMDKPKVSMTLEIEQAVSELREFMFQHVYLASSAKLEEEKAIHVVKQLLMYYLDHIEIMPQQFTDVIGQSGYSKEQVVCDYISGMTDSYAIKIYNDYFVPKAWSYHGSG